MEVFLVKRMLPLWAVLALLVGGLNARAQDNIDFNSTGGGTISYAGGANPLMGANIPESTVKGEGTAAHNGVQLTITGGTLNFHTGLFSGTSSTILGPAWNFAQGGSMMITGGVPALGIASGSTLLSGTLVGGSVVDVGGGTFKVTIDVATDPINSTIASYFGEPTGASILLVFGFSATGAPPGSFTSGQVFSGDVTTSPVPEPSAVVMLLSGLPLLVGIGWLRCRRGQKA
jgi:hypothetical protein